MPIDKQTPSAELQLVSSEEAAALLKVPYSSLRYSAWPQTVKVEGQLELITGEAWVYAPGDGRLDDDEPHPAVVFHRGVVLGTVTDLATHKAVVSGLAQHNEPRYRRELAVA